MIPALLATLIIAPHPLEARAHAMAKDLSPSTERRFFRDAIPYLPTVAELDRARAKREDLVIAVTYGKSREWRFAVEHNTAISGDREGRVITVVSEASGKGYWNVIAGYFLITRSGNGWKTELFDCREGWDGGTVCVGSGSAAMLGDELVIAGIEVTRSNWPRVGADSYRRYGKDWLWSGHTDTHYEGHSISGVKARDGAFEPIVAERRRYPEHVSMAHVGPLLTERQYWTFVGGRWVCSSLEVLATPIEALNRLAKAAKDNDAEAGRELLVRPEEWPQVKELLPKGASVMGGSMKGRVDDETTADFKVWESDAELHFRKVEGRWRLDKWSVKP